jgi:hypothetical protein
MLPGVANLWCFPGTILHPRSLEEVGHSLREAQGGVGVLLFGGAKGAEPTARSIRHCCPAPAEEEASRFLNVIISVTSPL